MSRFNTCDGCDSSTVPVFEVAQLRPSDSSSLCCILALCESCGGKPDVPPGTPMPADRIPSVGTTQQFDEWVEEHGYKHGVSFYE